MESLKVPDQYTGTTRDIRVTVVPKYIESESDIESDRYAYAYTVTLENLGNETVQLVNRHWVVVSGGRQIADVKGEGVVGEQPVLGPGENFEYTSWTVVNDSIGSMEGAYTFFSDRGEFFDVEIPRFHLIYVDQNQIH